MSAALGARLALGGGSRHERTSAAKRAPSRLASRQAGGHPQAAAVARRLLPRPPAASTRSTSPSPACVLSTARRTCRAVDGFLKSSECARLLGKAARARLRHSVQTDYATGRTYVSEERTTRTASWRSARCPRSWRGSRPCAACRRRTSSASSSCATLRASASPRTGTASRGCAASSGFVDSARVVTVFAYLTSVPPGGGGETRFPRLGLSIPPVRGMAVSTCQAGSPQPR